jgi:hypothetical protein
MKPLINEAGGVSGFRLSPKVGAESVSHTIKLKQPDDPLPLLGEDSEPGLSKN